jgi:Delta7-sterol 5-desaturase
LSGGTIAPILAVVPAFLTELDIVGLLLCVAAFLVGLTLLALGYGFLIERLLPKRRMYDVPLAKGQYRFELIGNLVFVAVSIAAVTLALRLEWVHFAGGWLRGVGTFFALMFGFQAFYYFLHRAMHHKSLLRFHRWHHRSQVTTPLSAQSVSFGEACAWMLGYVGLPLLFSRLVPISFEGWAGYLAFNVFGNIVGHSNVEPNGPQFGNRAIAWVVNPFIFHALHHARWTGHYSFQAGAMDRLFKTEWDDWPELFKRIIAGRALTSLKDRGGDGAEQLLAEPMEGVEKGT